MIAVCDIEENFYISQEKEVEKDKTGEESTVEKSEKESSEKMEEEEPDFELLENPARVLPAQVHCDFIKFAEKQKLPQHEQV